MNTPSEYEAVCRRLKEIEDATAGSKLGNAVYGRPAPVQAEFFRLPARGGDPFFGLSRSWYYAAEKAGWLQFRRLRTPGAIRGVVLVPIAEVRALIERAGATSKTSSAVPATPSAPSGSARTG